MQISRFRSQSSRLVLAVILLGTAFAGLSHSAKADLIEGFEDFTTLAPAGWSFQNLSTPVGSTGWFQGNSAAVFPAQAGTANSYLAANYNNTAGTGTINNWALSPSTTFGNGYVFSFYTRTTTGDFPDRLTVSYSTNGTSTNVTDFSHTLVTINPSLTNTGYPTDWTKYTFTLSGLAGLVTGRFGFNYNVTNAGPTGANSDFIGIDTFSLTATPPPPPQPPTATPITINYTGQGNGYGTKSGTHAANTIDWFSFNYTGGDISVDSIGSNFDTEIGLYNSLGDLVATNDDIDLLNGNLQSRVSFTNGTLATGQYYLALGGFDSTFGGAYGAVGGTAAGSYRVNVTVVPEANTGILVVLAGLPTVGLILRRRMRA